MAKLVQSRVEENSKQNCILVLGMHRSGTSLISQVLNSLGAALPATPMPPAPQNPEGFAESTLIMELNEFFLTEMHSRWDDWIALDTEAVSIKQKNDFESKISATIASEFRKQSPFVLKDPRIAKLAPFYVTALQREDVRIGCVQITRNPIEVAKSLEKRNGFQPSLSYLLWLRHTLDAELVSRDHPRIFVSYQDLLEASVEMINRLVAWGKCMGLSDKEEALHSARDRVKKHLYRNRIEELEEWGECNHTLRHLMTRTFECMSELEVFPDNVDTISRLDSIREQFNSAIALLEPVYRQEIEAKKAAQMEAINKLETQLSETSNAKMSLQAQCTVLDAQNHELRDTATELQAQCAVLDAQNHELRDTATEMLVNPFHPLKERFRYEMARRLHKYLKGHFPKMSARFFNSASKRDPLRFKK